MCEHSWRPCPTHPCCPKPGPAPDFTKLGLYMHMWTGLARLEPPWFFKGGYSPGLFASQLARGTAVPPLERLPLAYLWRGGWEVVRSLHQVCSGTVRAQATACAAYGTHMPCCLRPCCGGSLQCCIGLDRFEAAAEGAASHAHPRAF